MTKKQKDQAGFERSAPLMLCCWSIQGKRPRKEYFKREGLK